MIYVVQYNYFYSKFLKKILPLTKLKNNVFRERNRHFNLNKKKKKLHYFFQLNNFINRLNSTITTKKIIIMCYYLIVIDLFIHSNSILFILFLPLFIIKIIIYFQFLHPQYYNLFIELVVHIFLNIINYLLHFTHRKNPHCQCLFISLYHYYLLKKK